MADPVPEKTGALKFAERQLLRYGWERGKGLGRAENGISEPIKVKVKCDKGGVGHKKGEQFTFHWWDHVFNKASSSLQVVSDPSGIKLTKSAEEDEDDQISNKKPRKASQAKEKLYECFVKSATLMSGQEQPEMKESEENLDLSTSTKLSDSDLMKVCGGRTAHKGARHGLTMSAKLARLEQQEAEFMANYGQTESSASLCRQEEEPVSSQSLKKKKEAEEETSEIQEINSKKKKKPFKLRQGEKNQEVDQSDNGKQEETKVLPKKQKKQKRLKEEASADEEAPKKKKKKEEERRL